MLGCCAVFEDRVLFTTSIFQQTNWLNPFEPKPRWKFIPSTIHLLSNKDITPLKQTVCPWKLMVGRLNFLLRYPIFRGHVHFREGMIIKHVFENSYAGYARFFDKIIRWEFKLGCFFLTGPDCPDNQVLGPDHLPKNNLSGSSQDVFFSPTYDRTSETANCFLMIITLLNLLSRPTHKYIN